MVRRRVVEKAHARGVELTVGDVSIRWGHIELRDLHVTLEGVTGVEASAKEVTVGWSLSGLAREVTVDQPSVTAEGSIAVLRDELGAWRQRHATGGDAGGGSGRTIRATNASATWTVAGVTMASGSASALELDSEKVVVRGAAASGHVGTVELHLAGVDADYSRVTGRLGAISARSVEVAFGGTSAQVAELGVEGASVEAKAPDAPRIWALADRARALIAQVTPMFDPNVTLKADEVTLTTTRGALGPWALQVLLGEDATTVELLPADADGRKPLMMRAFVPRGRGRWTAELKAGPATLAEVGVKEDAFGLVDVAHATAEANGSIEMDPDERTIAADGAITVRGAAIADARIADDVVRGIDFSARGVLTSHGDLTSWTLSGGALEVGRVRLELDGSLDWGVPSPDPKVLTSTRVAMTWSIPTVGCADALSSLPPGLTPRLDGMAMDGTFGAHGLIAFDTSALDKTEVELGIDQHCRITHAPAALAVEQFHRPFDLRVYDPTGNPGGERKFGPGAPGWASYEDISPYVVDALLTCEDGAFFSHNGFSREAIRNALIANIKARKFLLGASTVTMQLAKNLFLDRKKQLSRKVQEAVLTAWLEQSLSKQEILELYLNVIEFGPNLYGIGPAAWHYFGRPPSDLDPLEALFLVSILPSPVKRHSMWAAGAPGAGYLDYLRVLLKQEHVRGKLEDDEYDQVKDEALVFHRQGDPMPAPHGIKVKDDPAKGTDDPAYDPVWAPIE